MQMLISLAVITATRLHSILSSMEYNINYWIELELQAVHWKPTCLTTGGCANPRFRISKSNKFNAEIISVSWSITENFVEVSLLYFTNNILFLTFHFSII